MRKVKSIVMVLTVAFCNSTCGLIDLGECVAPKPIADAALNWCRTAYVTFPSGYNAPVEYGAERSRDVKWTFSEGVEFLGYGETADGGENKEGVYVKFAKPGVYQLCATTLNKCGENPPTCRNVTAVPLKNEIPYPYDELVARTYPVGGYAGGKLYYGLGMFGKSLYDWYSYDLMERTFVTRASFPASEQFYFMRSVTVNEKIYVMTGEVLWHSRNYCSRRAHQHHLKRLLWRHL